MVVLFFDLSIFGLLMKMIFLKKNHTILVKLRRRIFPLLERLFLLLFISIFLVFQYFWKKFLFLRGYSNISFSNNLNFI